MASIFDRYGLKEVSNVSVFALEADTKNNVAKGDLVLYLDSLKVSTIEQTAETTDATGGWGNPKLISWDYSKEITLTLEDALLSPEFLRVMVGGSIKKATSTAAVTVNFTSQPITLDSTTLSGNITDTYGNSHSMPSTYQCLNMTTGERSQNSLGNAKVGDKVRIFFTEQVKEVGSSNAYEITISPSTFPGTYKFVGDTYLRSEDTGADEPYQWQLLKGKISSEVTFTMEAEGDPSSFELTVTALRAEDSSSSDGYSIMKFIKYNYGSTTEAASDDDDDDVVSDT